MTGETRDLFDVRRYGSRQALIGTVDTGAAFGGNGRPA
jgi:hypothetical protein